MGYLISIKVPTSHYLKKFILKRLKSKDSCVIIKDNRSDFIVLWKILSKAPYRVRRYKFGNYETEIQFWVSEYFTKYSGFELHKLNIYIFNQYLKKRFDEEMSHYIMINIENGYYSNIEHLIKSFLDFYGITEDEKSLGSCIKSFQRWRDSYK